MKRTHAINHRSEQVITNEYQPTSKELPIYQQRLGCTGKAHRVINILAQKTEVERKVVDIIDFRILRKTGALKR